MTAAMAAAYLICETVPLPLDEGEDDPLDAEDLRAFPLPLEDEDLTEAFGRS